MHVFMLKMGEGCFVSTCAVLGTNAAAKGFHVLTASDTCNSSRRTTQDMSRGQNCAFAVNAGPFNMNTGECSGAVITKNVTRHRFSPGNAQFGSTDSGEWVIGHISKESTAKELGIVELVTGFGWLVFNGSNVVPSTGGLQAPRTAVGHVP